jgi:hypothetical protein
MLGALKMDDEHLKDFYAGLAMMGLISVYRDDKSVVAEYTHRAFDIAEAMMEERSRRAQQSNGRDGSSV